MDHLGEGEISTCNDVVHPGRPRVRPPKGNAFRPPKILSYLIKK